MPILKDIASHAGVSVDTVSRALNRKNQEFRTSTATRGDKIRKLAAEMGYRPNYAARVMRTRVSKQIGVLTSDSLAYPYEYDVIVGINKRLQAVGYSLTPISTDSMALNRPDSVLAFQEKFMEGFFIMHISSTIQAHAENITPGRCIHLDSNVRNPFNCIYRDEYHAGSFVVKESLKLGYKRMLFVMQKTPDNAHLYSRERLRGVIDAAGNTGIPCKVMELTLLAPDLVDKSNAVVSRLDRETALIAVDASMASFLAHAAARKGLLAGRDYGLAACDESPQNIAVFPWLSRMRFDRHGLGLKAADLMLELLNGRQQIESAVLRDTWEPGETLPSRNV